MNQKSSECSGPNSTLVDVAVPLPLEGPFTYKVPDALVDRVEIGRRVLVPFRKKIVAGFIVARNVSVTTDHEIKYVLEIPNEASYLSEELWLFLRWIAEYYIVPVGAVLKTALPPGAARKSKAWAHVTPEGKEWLKQISPNSPVDLSERLESSDSILFRDLVNTIGRRRAQEALERGCLTLEERISRLRTNPRGQCRSPFPDREGSRSAGEDILPVLTEHQAKASVDLQKAIIAGGFHPFLLFGVTGSGKTEVYLRAIRETLDRKKRALVLVPEIALTLQSASRFMERLGGGIALFHSGLPPSQRLREWRRIRAGEVSVVIGARSAIFAPLEDLGLIVVDEEHDPSYKQEDSCPYNARDMALARGKLQGACVVLGSATPSFETFMNARIGKIRLLNLPHRHHSGAMPSVEVIDLKVCPSNEKKRAFLTSQLTVAIGEALSRNEQVVLYINRRGFDTFAQCSSCGYVFVCPNCDISLTHHKSKGELRCHICGLSRPAPPLCPSCAESKIFFGGVGTQKVEEELVRLFPEARVERLDRDSTRGRENLESILERFRKKEIDILTGTQMIVKGHDFPGISLVGILCGDASLHFPDFRSSERTFQILTQVAGRTGRERDSGKVILQTFDPYHEAIRYSASHAYEEFFEHDSVTRRELLYPPFGYLILVRIEGSLERKVETTAIKIGRVARMMKGDSKQVVVLGPAPSPRKKAEGKFRWQVLLKSAQREPVRRLVRSLVEGGHLKGSGLKIVVDVDPVDLM